MMIFLAVSAIVCSAIALEKLDFPYLWIASFWFVLLLFAFLKGVRPRALWFNLAILVLAVAGMEAWAGYQNAFRMEGHDPGKYINSDHFDLGYAANPDQRVRARRMLRDEVLYDVHYSIASNGLRVAPPVSEEGADECILFFGGSFTFGEGVNDDETLPFQTGLKTAGRYHVYNFGLHGYGPHQMLAALESSYVTERINCKPRFVIYQGIWFHAFRVAGMELWDSRGPHYVKDDAIGVKLLGRFEDDPYLAGRRWVMERLYRSNLFSRIHQRVRRPTTQAYETYLAIVKETQRLIETRYPDCEFHILFWDEPWLPMEGIFETGFNFHRVGSILPAGWREQRVQYQVHEHDQHPNRRSFEYLSDYVVGKIVNTNGNERDR